MWWYWVLSSVVEISSVVSEVSSVVSDVVGGRPKDMGVQVDMG